MRLQKLAPLALAAAVAASTLSISTASAAPAPFRPNVGVVVIWASTASVILDAMYIAATQCREMTSAEAGAALIPVVGPAYNSSLPSMSRCTR